MAESVDLLVAALQGESVAVRVRDWPGLIALATRHGVSGLLFQGLLAGDRETLPAETLAEVKGRNLGLVSGNFKLFAVLHEVLAACTQAGVDLVVLKGVYLADQIYAEMGMRAMGDIDLLVRPEQIDQAEGILQGLGFCDPDRRDAESRRSFCESHAHLPPLERVGEGVRIELHWSFEAPADPVQMDMAAVWARARPCALRDAAAWALHPADFLIHLCMHASYHHGFSMGLRTLCDIDACVRRWGESGEWLQLDRIAAQTGVSAVVQVCLCCARDVLDTPVPEALLGSLARRPDAVTAQQWRAVRERLLGVALEEAVFGVTRGPEVAGARSTGVRAAARFDSLRQAGDSRLRTVRRILWPAPERMRQIHGLPPGSSRVWLHYPARPLALLWRWGRGVLSGITRTPAASLAAQRESNRRVLGAFLDAETNHGGPRPGA